MLMSGTAYTDDALRVTSDTDPEEIRSFVERRTKNPIIVDGVTVFNYSAHEVDQEALENAVGGLYRDVYLIPFQLGPVWAYMTRAVPQPVLNAEYLMYDTDEEEYHPHTNFFRVSDPLEDRDTSEGLRRWVNKNVDFENEWTTNSTARVPIEN